MTLALLEGGALVAAVVAMAVTAGPAAPVAWADLAAVLGRATGVSAGCVVAFYYTDLYDARALRRVGPLGVRLLLSLGFVFVIFGVFYARFPQMAPEGSALVGGLSVVALLAALRIACYGVIRCRPFPQRVLVLGTTALARRILGELEAQPQLRYAVAVAGGAPARQAPPLPCAYLGPLDDLSRILAAFRPNRIVVALDERRERATASLLLESRVRGVAVEDGVDAYERLTGKLAIESLAPGDLLFARGFRRSRTHRVAARLLSVGVSAVGLVVLAPLCGLVALAILMDTGRPVLFVQDRVGLHGRRFRLVKFRTMRPGAGASAWVRDNGDRITRVGRWLRTFRLDELPQFVNVLRGDMNLIGPRPHPVSNYELFSRRIPYYSLRAALPPGVTGWAQVRYGYANDLEEETEKMRYDLYYVKHRSLWLDLRILVDTVKVVLFGLGSSATDARAGAEAPAAPAVEPTATRAEADAA